MAASSAKSGFGSILQVSSGATPAVFTSIAEITKIGGPALKRDSVDVTHMESPGGWREKIMGFMDGGEVSLEVNFFAAATQTARFTDMAADTPRTFRIVYSDGGDAQTATVDTGTELWTAVTHGWLTAQPVTFTSTGALPASTPAISVGKFFWAARTAANTVSIHPTSADAVAGTNAINFTGTGTGTHTIHTGMTHTFSAKCSGFAPEFPADGAMKATFTLTISGAVTVTPAA